MKIHMFGHATLLVETEDCTILFDPVLGEEFGEQCFSIRPARRVDPSVLSKVDVVIVSHRHLDHFDVQSLARIPRAVTVLVPQDGLIVHALQRLGFEDVHAVDEFTEIEIGETTILTTRSELRLPEHGWVISTPTATFWNQVDTIVSLSTVVAVRDRFPQIDFLLTPWQPMLEMHYQTGKGLHFPYEEYGRLLDVVSQIRPRALSPGANGFDYLRDSAWLNDVVFPADRQRFCADVVDACPGLADAVFGLDPGDMVVLDAGTADHRRGASPYAVRMPGKPTPQRFSPVSFDGRLLDTNPYGFDMQQVQRAVDTELKHDLLAFVRDQYATLFRDHGHWRTRYALVVVFPDHIQDLTLDFDDEGAHEAPADGPAPNYEVWITASGLYGLITERLSWDAVAFGGRYRTSSNVYRVGPHGLVRPTHCNLNDPLFLRFPEDELLARIIDRELDAVCPPAQPLAAGMPSHG